jgi:serpin B
LPKPNGALISADYAGLLKDKYQAEVFRDADLATVNGWVSRRTEGKIPRMLDVIDPRDVAIIVNAVYFKAGWRMPFVDTRRSDDGDNFNLTPTEKVKVTMMRGKGLYATVDRPGYRAIRLPYTVDALAMVIVLPDEIDGAGRIAGEFDAAALAGLLKDLNDPKEVEVSLPRFKTSFDADLKLLFARAGMVRAFDFSRADFSGMTGTVPAGLAITEIKHRADIEVTEYGTEAAASTYVRTQTSYHAWQVAPFVVDRPFLFYITDDATGAILFQGRISDPRQPRS